MTNMDIYEHGRAVPKEAQKSFDNGRFQGTDINPMWRIKKMTEIFGPCGIGWYYEVLSERCEEHDNMTIAVVDLNLYVKVEGEWSKPIYGTGGNVIKRFINKTQRFDVSDEGYKMALTDALSVACKALGIGADIYFGADRTKYSAAQETTNTAVPAAPKPAELVKCSNCGHILKEEIGRDGQTVTVNQQIDLNLQYKTGRTLCKNCLKAYLAERKAAAMSAKEEE